MAALSGSGGRGIPLRPVESTPGAGDADVNASDGEAGTARRRVGLQQAMTRGAGVVRTASSLRTALDSLRVPAGTSAATAELSNLATLGRALVAAALQRTESRGNHWRADHEDLDPRFAVRLVHNLP
jgi:L-aspartate oxidase